MLLKQDYSQRDWPIKTHYFEVWYDILLENLVKLCLDDSVQMYQLTVTLLVHFQLNRGCNRSFNPNI